MAQLAINTSPFQCRWISAGTEMRLEHWTYAICLRCRNRQRLVSEDECSRCDCWEPPSEEAQSAACTRSDRGARRFTLLCLFAVLFAAGCGAPAAPPQQSAPVPPAAASLPELMSPVSINAEMVRVVDHAAHQLWNAEKPDMAPKTDADWENIVEHATQVAAAGALIRLEGTGPNDRTFVHNADWQKFAAATSAAGVAALKAGEARNQEALVAANGQLVDACEGCHKQFKPALPSEGIMHVHAR